MIHDLSSMLLGAIVVGFLLIVVMVWPAVAQAQPEVTEYHGDAPPARRAVTVNQPVAVTTSHRQWYLYPDGRLGVVVTVTAYQSVEDTSRTTFAACQRLGALDLAAAAALFPQGMDMLPSASLGVTRWEEAVPGPTGHARRYVIQIETGGVERVAVPAAVPATPGVRP